MSQIQRDQWRLEQRFYMGIAPKMNTLDMVEKEATIEDICSDWMSLNAE